MSENQSVEDLLRITSEAHKRQTENLEKATERFQTLSDKMEEHLKLMREVIAGTDSNIQKLQRITAAQVRMHEERQQNLEA